MEKYLFIGGLMLVSALIFPEVMSSKLDENRKTVEAPQQIAVEPAQTAKKSRNPLDGRKEYIEMDSRGHFMAEARMNGYKSKVLVDTGATYVAINESTARKLGIYLKDADFKYKVNTANGVKLAAAIVIDEIQIGRVRVQNVQASVSRDASLSTTLLGMSFLKKLNKFEISNGELILTQ